MIERVGWGKEIEDNGGEREEKRECGVGERKRRWGREREKRWRESGVGERERRDGERVG